MTEPTLTCPSCSTEIKLTESLAAPLIADTRRRYETQDRPLAFLAGIWTTWHGRRGTKANPVEGEHQLFGFLTTDANAEVGAIHPKAMPVILTSMEAVEQWLTLPVKEALALQKPLPDGALRIVATGEKEDSLAA